MATRSRAWRRLVVAIGTAALVSACAAGQASLAPSAPETSRATPSPPATHGDAPSAVPTPSATPTTQGAGDVVLTITHDHVGDAWSTTSLVADGRLTSPSDAGWQVRVLAPEGLERVRSEVVATGLFSESLVIPAEVVPGAGPECLAGDGMGFTFGVTIELATAAGPVSVSWQRATQPPHCYVPSAERDRMESLLAALETPVEWLPPEAWTDSTARPHDPHGYRLITIAAPMPQGLEQLPDAGSLTSFGDDVAPVAWPESRSVRCGVVSATEAGSLTVVLANAGAALTPSNPAGYASATLLDDAQEQLVVLVLEALRPDEKDCTGIDLRILNCWAIGGIAPFGCALP